MMELKGKRVTVIGLARSGLTAALLLKENGASVSVTDSAQTAQVKENAEVLKARGIEVELGRHTQAFIKGRDLIVKSPGVPMNAAPLLWAKWHHLAVISEIELAYWFCQAPIIAVTGTNGKSTVATLIGKILRDAGRDVVVCGNIGNPFSGEIGKIGKDGIVVLEVSSFQLQTIESFRPKVAVLLNVTRNHFDRHMDFEDYIQAKKRVFANQQEDDYAVLFYNDPVVRSIAGEISSQVLYFSSREKVEGSSSVNGKLILREGDVEKVIMGVSRLKIAGEHNVLNALASIAAVSVFGVDKRSIVKSLSGFRGLEHRFEYVTTIDGVRYINDSKATSVDATMNALRSLDGMAVLIAGGRDKNSDFGVINDLINERAKAVILIGEARDKIRNAIRGRPSVEFAESLPDAVRRAKAISAQGDTVLFSPMCTSFDMFRDFEERGCKFKEAVASLVKLDSVKRIS